MKAQRTQVGLTLVELAASLAIAAFVIPLIAGIIYAFQFAPGRTRADVAVQHDLEQAGRWIAADANAASAFSTSSLAVNEYAALGWTEFGGPAPSDVVVTYLYDAASSSLARRVERDGLVERTNAVARNIASQDDVSFAFQSPAWQLDGETGRYEFRPGVVTASVTSTAEKIGGQPARRFEALAAQMRGQFPPTPPTPGPTPTPMPTPTPAPAPTATPTPTPGPTPTRTPSPTPAPTPTPTPDAQPRWTPLASTPGSVGAGGALTTNATTIYALRGRGTTGFWAYLPGANQWSALAGTPATTDEGAALVWAGGDYVYALRGNNTRTFWRYRISTNTWATMANSPQKVRWGGALVWDGADTLYAIRGDNRKDFWRYRISTNSWTTLVSAPNNVKRGGAMVYVAGRLYAFHGEDKVYFSRYDVAAATWTAMTDAPAPVGAGGSLVWNNGAYIYALRGNASTDFWRYGITTNGWATLPPAPAPVGEGGALVYLGGALYAMRGGDTPAFWKFQ